MSHRRVSIATGRWIRRETTPTSVRSRSSRSSSIFTPAELRVLQPLPSHLSNAEIATQLMEATTTVKTQVSAIYRKLGVTPRSQAVTAARALGLLN